MTKRAVITGITGQDGSYLAELLLEKGYEVHGLIRRSSSPHTERIDHLCVDPQEPEARLRLHYGDMTDAASLRAIIEKARPDEVYNLAAQSHVQVSFDIPEYTIQTIVIGTTNLLGAIRQAGIPARYYQAGTNEVFGTPSETPQSETTPFRPRSPYAAAKAGAHAITATYRDAYGMFTCNGIAFSHESPRRATTFVTRKITRGLARVIAGKASHISLGNLDAKRDWGYAPEYVEAMWLMLQQDEPDDFVIATGESHSVREFLEATSELAGLDPEECVRFDERYLRPAEIQEMRGDASKARQKLGWEPHTRFHGLVRIMMEADLANEGLDPTRYMGPSHHHEVR